VLIGRGTAAGCIVAFVMGKLHLLDALIRRLLPMCLNTPDAYAPNTYPNP